MVTEKQYRWIADHVYSVDHNKHDGQYTKIKEKRIILTGETKI
ncbi:hypothetical protein [Streptococcus thoraltensis]|nr:hypothetical protein [Streptococcus thoraltensis]